MPQYWAGNIAYVVRCHKFAFPDRRQGFRTQKQSDGGARAGAIMYEWVCPRAPDDVYCITLHARLHSHTTNPNSTASNCIGIGEWLNRHLIQTTRIESRIPVGHHLLLFNFRW